MRIIIIAKTEVDFKKFLLLSNSVLGRPISRELDFRDMIPKSLPDFIALMDEFSTPGSDPFNSLVDAGDLLKHVHLSMFSVMQVSVFMDLLGRTGLHCTTTQELPNRNAAVVISGTLEEFREGVINLSTERTDQGTRTFMNGMLSLLDAEGFGILFAKYSRCKYKDGTTLLLEHKL